MYSRYPIYGDTLHPSLEPFSFGDHPIQSRPKQPNNFLLPPLPPADARNVGNAFQTGHTSDDDDLPPPEVAFGVFNGSASLSGYLANPSASHPVENFTHDRGGYVSGSAPRCVDARYLGAPSHPLSTQAIQTTTYQYTPSVPRAPTTTPIPPAPIPKPAIMAAPLKAATPPTTTATSQSTKTNSFTANDLTQLVRVCADLDVFSAPRGKIGATWAEVGRLVRGLGINHSNDVLRKKVDLLLDWHDVCIL